MRFAKQLIACGLVPFASFCVAVTAIFSAVDAQAAVEKLRIAFSRTIDPETGLPSYHAENPSGDADITLGERSLVVKYIDREGTSRVVPIFFDAAQLADAAELAVSNSATRAFQAQFEKNGAGAARKFVQASIAAAAQAEPSGERLVMFFDSTRKAGFMNQNFVAGEVHLTSGTQDFTLRAATLKILTATTAVPNSTTSEARPIGFTATGYSTMYVCRELFLPAP